MSQKSGLCRLMVVLLAMQLFWPAVVLADDLAQHQKWFERAEQLAHKPNSSEYKFLKAKLADYPLWPYVTYKTLLRFPYLSNEKRIAEFLTQYKNTPMDKPLRRKWLNHLSRQKRPELFLKYYADIGDVSLNCLRIQYAAAKDGYERWWSEIESLWVVGKSQPKECDPLFDKWQAAGHRTNAVIHQRLQLAANGGNSTLIPYLKKLLPAEERYLADIWLAVRRAPSQLTRESKFKGTVATIETDILTYGFKRLIWRDPKLALKTWASYRRKFPFSAAQKQDITYRFAIALASKNHPDAEVWLERAGSQQSSEELLRWHLTHVLRTRNWHHALDLIKAVTPELTEDISYQYWQARALELLGNQTVAEQKLRIIANERHYYGFMASGKLAQDVNLQNHPFSTSSVISQSLMKRPAMARIEAFVALGRKTSARREWNMLVPTLPKEEKQLAAMLASTWEWHDQAIHGFSKAGYLDDVARRFPLAYKKDLLASAKKHDINPAWAFAITRRESSFKSDARSGAGARGLMQLLPSTAQYLQKRKIKKRELFQPKFNLEMGTKYLNYLMDKMDSNTVLATASYNAGWRRVRDWIPDDKAIPADVWIETIPYKETRNYVKAVLAYKQIYHHLLGQDNNYFTEYSRMHIGG